MPGAETSEKAGETGGRLNPVSASGSFPSAGETGGAAATIRRKYTADPVKTPEKAGETGGQKNSDPELALAAARYRTIDRLCRDCFTPAKEGRGRRITHRLDRLLVASPLAYPIFFLLLALVFAVTFPLAGRFLTGLLEDLLDRGAATLDAAFSVFRVSPAGTLAGSAAAVLYGFLSDGLLRGVGSVVGFLPVILILFFFLAILEDSGTSRGRRTSSTARSGAWD